MNKIAIHGAPRSGTTWLANIVNSNEAIAYRQQPLFSYAFKDYLNENSTREKIDSFFNEIYNSKDDYLNQVREIKDGKYLNLKRIKPLTLFIKKFDTIIF